MDDDPLELMGKTEEQKKAELLKVLDWLVANQEFVHHVYPCTVIPSRYSGTYEGASWLAFNCYQDAVPQDATGGDNECGTFWDMQAQGMLSYPRPRYGDADTRPPEPIIVGKGESPNLAVADLARKLGGLDE